MRSPTLRHRLEYAGFRVAHGVLAALPLGVAMRIAAAIAVLVIRVDRRHRRIGLVNLGIAFPERSLAERTALLEESYRNLGRTIAECTHVPRLDRTNVRDVVRIEDETAWKRELLDPLADGSVLILTGHFGNWELCHYAYALLDQPVHLVHQTIKNPLVDAFVEHLRASSGTILLRKHGAAREVLRALHRGGIMVLPLDQNASGRTGTFVPFFGMPASTNAGFGRIAVRTGTRVVPAFLVRDGASARHRIVFLPAVPIASMADRDSAAHDLTLRCTAVLEEFIRRHPEQWLWTHKRWRTRPLGESDPYRGC